MGKTTNCGERDFKVIFPCQGEGDDGKQSFPLIFFQVVSRGRILSHNTTDPFDGKFKSWSVFVTSQMSPSARLIVYYIDNNERIVADSILLNIEDSLPTKVSNEKRLEPSFALFSAMNLKFLSNILGRFGVVLVEQALNIPSCF